MLKGLDAVQRQLKHLERKARDLHGTQDVPLTELLNDGFVSRNTDFASLNEMTEAYGGIETGDDLQTDEWSGFVAAHSRFAGWQEMAQAAGAEWAKAKLGL